MIAVIYWDPPRFAISFITWYGILFAVSFFLGYLWVRRRLKENAYPWLSPFMDKLSTYVMLGTIIGARLGHFCFYEPWKEWLQDPLSLFRIREGGLASHGAVIGISLSLFIFYKKYSKKWKINSFFSLISLLLPVIALSGGFIRIGNFINQEILGTQTQLPWGVIFGHPLGSFEREAVVRHPVQIYEAIFYFGLFLFFALEKKYDQYPMKKVGLFLLTLFSFRFLIEFLKMESNVFITPSFLNVGQWLSIPLVIIGIYLFSRKSQRELLFIDRDERELNS